jgi:hypothetical protein
MVALCVPLGLTTCVLPYSNGLFAPASNAYSFLYTQSHLPQRNKPETAHQSPTKPQQRQNQSVPDARELLPPKLIPRTIAAPPHPLLATRPANAAVPATTATIQQPTSGPREQIKGDAVRACVRTREQRRGLGIGVKGDLGGGKGCAFFGWRWWVASGLVGAGICRRPQTRSAARQAPPLSAPLRSAPPLRHAT